MSPAQKVWQLAWQEAQRIGLPEPGPFQILVGLLKAGGATARFLEVLGVDLRRVRDAAGPEELPADDPSRRPFDGYAVRQAVAETWIADLPPDSPHVVEG